MRERRKAEGGEKSYECAVCNFVYPRSDLQIQKDTSTVLVCRQCLDAPTDAHRPRGEFVN